MRLLERAMSISDDELMLDQAHVKRGLAGDGRVDSNLTQDALFLRGDQNKSI